MESLPETVAGRYRVIRELGRGGMGVVYVVEHAGTGEQLALKVMTARAGAGANAIERFKREARAPAKIKSEHVARVIDVGTLDTGAPYMVMEYLEGIDLRAELRQSGSLPIERAVEYILQAAEAVAEAHSLGIVHRDLKPANLFLAKGPDGSRSVKVLDFGVSKVTKPGVADSELDLTRTDAVMGSPRYIAPEQLLSSRDADARADIWALGNILYECVSGQRPFRAASLAALCAAVLKDPPVPLREAKPGVPAALDALVVRCLQKDPAHRFQSMAELARALVEFSPVRGRISLERIARILEPDVAFDEAGAIPTIAPERMPTQDPLGGSEATAKSAALTLSSTAPSTSVASTSATSTSVAGMSVASTSVASPPAAVPAPVGEAPRKALAVARAALLSKPPAWVVNVAWLALIVFLLLVAIKYLVR